MTNDSLLEVAILANIIAALANALVIGGWHPPNVNATARWVFHAALVLLFVRIYATVRYDWARDVWTTIAFALVFLAQVNLFYAVWFAANRPRRLR